MERWCVWILSLGVALGVELVGLQAQETAHAPDTTQVVVLGYHRFEDPPRDPLAISSAEFRQQLQSIREQGLEVISLDDFLAWRKGEITLPPRSVLITIDDGYVSGYSVAWPILKEFNYPFVMFVYTNYISAGGKSITWDQLREMEAAGVSIQSHSVSHTALTRRQERSDEDYRAWLWHELHGSRTLIEEGIGKPVYAIAYPYGVFNETVQRVAEEAGYQLQFTVHGKKIYRASRDNELGRYVVLSGKPEIFQSAIHFGGAIGVEAVQLETHPPRGAYVGEASPLISAKLDAFGSIDPGSIELFLSGYGRLPATYDPNTNTISFQIRDRLRASSYTARVAVRSGGKRLQADWDFIVDRKLLFESLLPGGTPPPTGTKTP